MTLVFFTDRDLGTLFPAILKGAGLPSSATAITSRPNVPTKTGCPRWAARTGCRDPDANARIRYKPTATSRRWSANRARLLVVVGKAPLPDLAASFVADPSRIEDFEGGVSPSDHRQAIG